MTSPGVFTPYSTVRNLMGTLPTWIPDQLDQERILSYQVYEQIYWGVPETFKIVARGTEDKPIYVPTGRIIVDTTHRYVASGFDFSVDLRTGGDSSQSADAQAVTLAMEDLWTRERFRSKFNGNKRYGLIRGDWAWHIVADDTKLPGSRISIYPLDPASYFPIWDEDDLDKIVGCHIVDTVQVGNDQFIKRLTYRKTETGSITSEESLFKVDDWFGPEAKVQQVLKPLTELPPTITALPVYHIKNFEEPANPFGSSELRGLERIIASVNQTISDEELTLALEGLGVYATDAPPPVDENDQETTWQLGPGRVVEHPAGSKFERITGVGSVKPSQDHLAFLLAMIHEASGTPDVARGKVDVKVAESGISLMLQMAPMLAKVDEKDQLVKDVHDQMFFDLVNGWFPGYESTSFGDARVRARVGDKLPVDRAARFKELNDMLDKGVISSDFYRSEATKLGYKFPDTMVNEIAADNATKAALVDPFGTRLAQEDPANTDPAIGA
jgi:hypothetical protein